jgi:hypothetical protein
VLRWARSQMSSAGQAGLAGPGGIGTGRIPHRPRQGHPAAVMEATLNRAAPAPQGRVPARKAVSRTAGCVRPAGCVRTAEHPRTAGYGRPASLGRVRPGGRGEGKDNVAADRGHEA